jgi:enamine deaminase RidA (YjgF/YER057c/UK114 family)
VRSYHVNIDETAELVIAKFKSEMGDRRPIWTCVEVSKLGIEEMVVEIEVEAAL